MGQFLSCRARSGPEKQSQSAFRSSSPGRSGRAYADTGQPGRETKTVCTGCFKVIPPHSEKQDRVASGAELLRLCLINCFIFQTALFSQIFIKKNNPFSEKDIPRLQAGKKGSDTACGDTAVPSQSRCPGLPDPRKARGRPGGIHGGKKRQRVCQKQPRMSQPVCRIHSPMGSFWARRKNVIWDFCPLCLVNFPKKGEGRALRHLNPLLRNDLRKSRTGKKESLRGLLKKQNVKKPSAGQNRLHHSAPL